MVTVHRESVLCLQGVVLLVLCVCVGGGGGRYPCHMQETTLTFVGYAPDVGKGLSEVRSEYLRSMVFLVAGQ